MDGKTIRREGISAPGMAHGGDAATENLGLIAGALLEIAAQLADLNDNIDKLRKDGLSVTTHLP